MYQPKFIRLLDYQPDTGSKPKRYADKKTDAQTYLHCLRCSHVHNPLQLLRFGLFGYPDS
jgi:hypothetical protein